MPAVKRIIVIGDIHGDYNLAVESLLLAKIIDSNLEWIAKPNNTIVVQVGDQIDNYRPKLPDNNFKKADLYKNEDLKVMMFFDLIDIKAKKYGGRVISLLGNHELLNVNGVFDYVSNDNKEFFEYPYNASDNSKYVGEIGRKKAFAQGGPIASNMACTRNSVVIIGSNMFIHAGILPHLVDKLKYLNIDSESKLIYLNNLVRGWLLNQIKLDKTEHGRNLNLFINDADISPFWTRILGNIKKDEKLIDTICETNVNETLQTFKIGHIIIGHTPQMNDNGNNINGTCVRENGEKTLYRVDGGFSHSFDKFTKTTRVQVLEIINDNIFNIIKGERNLSI